MSRMRRSRMARIEKVARVLEFMEGRDAEPNGAYWRVDLQTNR
jgi:hypothetical protein